MVLCRPNRPGSALPGACTLQVPNSGNIRTDGGPHPLREAQMCEGSHPDEPHFCPFPSPRVHFCRDEVPTTTAASISPFFAFLLGRNVKKNSTLPHFLFLPSGHPGVPNIQHPLTVPWPPGRQHRFGTTLVQSAPGLSRLPKPTPVRPQTHC